MPIESICRNHTNREKSNMKIVNCSTKKNHDIKIYHEQKSLFSELPYDSIVYYKYFALL